MKFSEKPRQEVSTGSMADIAFLLLIFFLVTTQIQTDHGLQLRLPPDQDEPPEQPIHERNLFKIQVNSNDKVLVENETMEDLGLLKEAVMNFISNHGKDENLSDSPIDAVVSIKTDRDTSYARYIEILDLVQGAYYSLRAEKAGISVKEYRNLDLSEPDQFAIYQKGKEGIPMQISIAEPTNVSRD